MKKVYIHNRLLFVEFDDLLPDSYRTGSTIEDYNNGAYILLNDEQIAFWKSHPGCTTLEAFNMQRDKHERTLEQVVSSKIQDIEAYGTSDLVDIFYINGIPTWLTPEQRSNYRNSIESAELLDEESVIFRIGQMEISVSLQQARIMLAQVQRYADACFLVTEKHKDEVSKLKDIQTVVSFDVTADYPEHLNFTIS